MDGLRDVVRTGYDSLSWAYRGDHDAPAQHRSWVELLRTRLPAGAAVLDLGCGCGVPVARDLCDAGHRVTGVDVSAVQIDRARRLVPQARFLEADLTTVALGTESFDAVVCLYVLIHLPDDEQRRALGRIVGWLRPGGTLLVTVGVDAATGSDPDWLGAGVTMWWSHPDLDTMRAWVRDAGLRIDVDRFVPEGDRGHQLIVATSIRAE